MRSRFVLDVILSMHIFPLLTQNPHHCKTGSVTGRSIFDVTSLTLLIEIKKKKKIKKKLQLTVGPGLISCFFFQCWCGLSCLSNGIAALA